MPNAIKIIITIPIFCIKLMNEYFSWFIVKKITMEEFSKVFILEEYFIMLRVAVCFIHVAFVSI